MLLSSLFFIGHGDSKASCMLNLQYTPTFILTTYIKTLDGAGYIFPPNVHNLKNLRTFVFRHLHLSMIQDEDTQEIKLLNGSQSHIYNAWHIVDNFPTTLTHATLPVDEIYEKYYLTMYHHPQAYEAMLSNLEILSITPSYHRHTYDLYKDRTW